MADTERDISGLSQHELWCHPSWHVTIPEQGFVWCIDCQRTVYRPPQDTTENDSTPPRERVSTARDEAVSGSEGTR